MREVIIGILIAAAIAVAFAPSRKTLARLARRLPRLWREAEETEEDRATHAWLLRINQKLKSADLPGHHHGTHRKAEPLPAPTRLLPGIAEPTGPPWHPAEPPAAVAQTMAISTPPLPAAPSPRQVRDTSNFPWLPAPLPVTAVTTWPVTPGAGSQPPAPGVPQPLPVPPATLAAREKSAKIPGSPIGEDTAARGIRAITRRDLEKWLRDKLPRYPEDPDA